MKAGEKASVVLRFSETVLGTAPKNPETYADYIASKIAKRRDLTDEEKEEIKAQEIKDAYESLESTEERGWTTFLRDDRGWWVYDYWIGGFFKTAFAALQETGDFTKLTAYKTKIDRYLHIFGMENGTRQQRRRIYFGPNLEPEQTDLAVLERPLRVMTPKGPRTSLARSDVMPEGTTISFLVELLKNNTITMDHVERSLEYGQYFGMGQWASGGWGTFEVISFDRK